MPNKQRSYFQNRPQRPAACTFVPTAVSLLQCDIIIDETYEQSTGGLTQMSDFIKKHGIADYATEIPAVTAAQVYTVAGTTGMTVTTPGSFNLGSVGLDWFERGTSRCDEVRKGAASHGGSSGPGPIGGSHSELLAPVRIRVVPHEPAFFGLNLMSDSCCLWY